MVTPANSQPIQFIPVKGSFPTEELGDNGAHECPVCYETMQDLWCRAHQAIESRPEELASWHFFHSKCLLDTLTQHPRCPTCMEEADSFTLTAEEKEDTPLMRLCRRFVDSRTTVEDKNQLRSLIKDTRLSESERDLAVGLIVQQEDIEVLEILLDHEASLSQTGRMAAVNTAAESGRVWMVWNLTKTDVSWIDRIRFLFFSVIQRLFGSHIENPKATEYGLGEIGTLMSPKKIKSQIL